MVSDSLRGEDTADQTESAAGLWSEVLQRLPEVLYGLDLSGGDWWNFIL